MAMANVSEIVPHVNDLPGHKDMPNGVQDSGFTTSQEDQEGYVVSPPVQCKLEVSSELEKETDLPCSSWNEVSVNVKEELGSNDANSRESTEGQDAELLESHNVHNSLESPEVVPCSACGLVVTSLDELYKHQAACQLIIGRPHLCNICNEGFERKSDLSNHIICHQMNRPHACRRCGSLFRRKADLQNHMVIHQTERPHKCSICGADFQRHSSLTNHMKIHNYSPGRALFPKVTQSTSISQPGVSSNLNRKSTPLWPPERSKEPIPSFETLPAPGYSFQHLMNGTSIQTNTGANWSFFDKMENRKVTDMLENGTDIPKPPPASQPSVDTASPLPSISNLDLVGEAASSNNLEATFQFDLEQEERINSENHPQNITITDPAFLSVKEVGLLYGIKLEDQYSSSQHPEQQQAFNPEEPQQETNIHQNHQFGQEQQSSNQQHVEQLQHDILICEAQQVIPKCREQLVQNGSSDEHSYMDTDLKPHICTKCGIRFTRLKAYQSHMRLHYENWDTPQMCPHCSQMLPDITSLNLHISTCQEEEKCVNVTATSPSEAILEADGHFEQTAVHNKTGFKHVCVECEKKFATKQKLFRHMWIHRKKQFTCEACGLVFSERSELDEHRLASHPPSRTTPFACHECGKSFASRQSLWEHGRVHGGSGPGAAGLLWCQQCNKSFASRQGYQIHTRTHTGERPYGCRYCWKSFRDGGTLRKHERIHTGERPHACPICSRAFNQKVVLREHVRWVHAAASTGSPPHPCQICNALLSGREELCAHIVKHSDDLAAVARAAAKEATNPGLRSKTRASPNKRKANVLLPTYDGKFVSVSTTDIEKASSNNAVAEEYLRTVKAAQSTEDEDDPPLSHERSNDFPDTKLSSFRFQNTRSHTVNSLQPGSSNALSPVSQKLGKTPPEDGLDTREVHSPTRSTVGLLPLCSGESNGSQVTSALIGFQFDHMSYISPTSDVTNNVNGGKSMLTKDVKIDAGLNEWNGIVGNHFNCELCHEPFTSKKALMSHINVHM